MALPGQLDHQRAVHEFSFISVRKTRNAGEGTIFWSEDDVDEFDGFGERLDLLSFGLSSEKAHTFWSYLLREILFFSFSAPFLNLKTRAPVLVGQLYLASRRMFKSTLSRLTMGGGSVSLFAIPKFKIQIGPTLTCI